MSIPYRPLAKPAAAAFVAYLEIIGEARLRKYYGGLLITDGRGQPVEFVHNCAETPSGMLWAESEVRRVAVQTIAHSLFEACSKSPSILVGQESLGSATYCSVELAPSIPFALVSKEDDEEQVSLAWTSTAPTPGSAGDALVDELRRRGLLFEPFSRMRGAFEEVYPELRARGV